MKRRNFMRFFEAKTYSLQEGGNPLFPHKESPRGKLWAWGVASVLLAGAGITACGFFIYGPYFTFKNITVSGTETLQSSDIENVVRQQLLLKDYGFLPNDHRLFFNVTRTEAALQETFPLKSVKIEKQGSTVSVSVVEDVFMVAFRSGDEVYFLDREGKVLRIAEPTEKAAVLIKIGLATPDSSDELPVLHSNMPVIREKNASAHNPGDQLFDAQILQEVIDFSDSLRQIGIQPVEFVSDDVHLPWFSITSNKDFSILFDATRSVATQQAVLETVLDQDATASENIQYIDVRFGTRVYLR